MTETTNTTVPDATPAEETEEPSLNFVQKFVTSRPRTAKVVAIVGGVAAVLGVGTVINTVRKNSDHLELAADHASEAVAEIGNAVSPSPETQA